jgi:type II secretory pathway pseudopilin PulG
MNKQKGFTLLEGLLIVLILCVVGFAGYTVWNNNQDEVTTENNQQEVTKNVDDKLDNEAMRSYEIDYSSWVARGLFDENASASYGSTKDTSSLDVFTENSPRIFYSSNAPVYCQYESGEWNNYSTFSGDVYTRDDSTDACDKIEQSSLNGLKTYTRFGGALGQIKYIVAVEVNDTWLVFSDTENYDADREINQEIPPSEYEEINESLKSRLENRILETIK